MTPYATLTRQLRRLTQARLRWKQRIAAKQRLIRKLRVAVRDLALSRERWKHHCQLLRQTLPAASSPPDLLALPLHPPTEEPALGEA